MTELRVLGYQIPENIIHDVCEDLSVVMRVVHNVKAFERIVRGFAIAVSNGVLVTNMIEEATISSLGVIILGQMQCMRNGGD